MLTVTKNPNGLLSEYYRYERKTKKIASEFDELISNPQRCNKLLSNYNDSLLMCDKTLDELNDLTEAMGPCDPRREIYRTIVENERDTMPEKELRMEKMKDSLLKTNTKQANKKTEAALYFGSIFITTLIYLTSRRTNT